MLRQQHFLHQRKNLYTKNLYEVFQARQNQRILTKILRLLSPFSLPIHPRTLSELVWRRSGWDGDRGIIKEGRRETRDIKTFGLETASEFGNTTALFALLKTWEKSAQLANAQTMHFFPITQPLRA